MVGVAQALVPEPAALVQRDGGILRVHGERHASIAVEACGVEGRTHETPSMPQALEARLEAEVDPANVASTRVLERVGFVREGLLRQRWLREQRPYDVAIYGLLGDEFEDAAAAERSR